MAKIQIALIVFGLVALAAASNVLTLTDATFDGALEENDLLLVKFYAPWCGHCKKLAPEWEEAADTLANDEARGVLAKVDCTENSEVCSRFSVQGYPTLKLFLNGKGDAPVDYNRERSAAAIVDYMKKKAEPAVASVEDVAAFAAKDGTQIVLSAPADADVVAAFGAFAQANEQFNFGHVVADDVSITLYREFNDEALVFDADFDDEAFLEWLNTNAYPVVNEIGQETFQRIAGLAKPIIVVALDYDDEATKEEWLATLNELGDDYPTLSITYGPSSSLARAVESFGGTGNVIPIAIGMKTPGLAEATEDIPTKNLPERWSFDESNEFNVESFKKFLDEAAAGTSEPYKKSEPVPEDNNGPVTVLVADNFDQAIEGKSAFVKFYAPWCGHCKSLAPVWEELGEKFADNDNVVIGKLDATANYVDSKFEVTGFPTLIFFNADGTYERYQSGRDLESLAEFVEDMIDEGLEEETGKDEL